MTAALLSPITLGNLELANRILMAPLTRTRAEGDHAPGALMAEYYAQRASAGLIIAEATMVMPGTSAFINEPGIYSQAQIDGWRQVTNAVHAQGGKIVLQIWHGGRACHPDMNDGKQPVAPSPIAIDDEVYTRTGKQPYTQPRELSIPEIKEIVAAFRQAAENAKLAGFDGVEVHGANGYLIDSFLRSNSNQRNDVYGGSLENRARFLFEVLDAVAEVWDNGNIGLRTSPLNGFNSMQDNDPEGMTAWLAEQLNRYNLAYWHLMRSDFQGQQQGDVVTPARQHYRGNLVTNMGYSAEEASTAITTEQADAIAFGVPFIANPDLVSRIQHAQTLTEADPKTFYTRGPVGYTDYPVATPA